MFNFLKTLVEVIQRLNSYYYYSNGIKGTVLPVNAANYVKREVDVKLYEFIKNYEQKFPVCYVFGTPQSGKSSIRLRTAKKLEEEGYISISLSAQTLSYPVTEDFFYSHLVQEISYKFKQFGSEVVLELQSFWQTLKEQSYEIKFPEFIRQTIRFSKNKTLVIFLDDSQNLAEWEGLRTFLENLCIPNFALVLFGNVHPSKVLPLKNSGQNPITVFDISPLEGECPPLQGRLRVVSQNPKALFQDILTWTGGQPFLTNFLCFFAVKWLRIEESHAHTELLRTLVQEKIVQKWTSQPVLVSHFQAIEDYYIQGDPRVAEIQFLALEIYKQVLQHPKFTHFSEQSLAQRELLVSGLVTKRGGFLDVANPIYGKVFDLNWIEKIQKKLNSGRLMMTLNLSIYDRDCFFLVSKGASMTNLIAARDSKARERYYAIKDSVKGHIAEVLRVRPGAESKRVSDQATLAFFNINKVARNNYNITDHNQVDAKFDANTPAGDAFITPTFKGLMNKWFEERPEDRGAIVFVYTDGELTDFNEFVVEIKNQCKKLKNHSYLKILIVGVGEAIQSPVAVENYFHVDLNGYGFEDRDGNPCNVVIFNRLESVNEYGAIQSILEQLVECPELGLPDWLKEEYPDLYEKLKRKYDLP
ncbi:ATP-binding protein [Kamptonema sp. UHCC 0994]|uniref:ATP-binding protein n=1 Tax=Kamptonema sp. UHCC 0994 TaxID=3031329 RepID=UPI0023B91EB8|nr:ATP-binding protein [Kamptonema sp. UHCC 0994]MDF0554029.1 ATP-binding protein [Kamptonema sp. UHCC 0994]